MKKLICWLCGLAATLPLVAQAQVDLSSLDHDMTGARSKVLVLGSIHLNSMPKDFNPASLEKLLDRLAAFKPEIITIETENSEECDLAARHPAKYGLQYCPSTAAAKAATGLDLPSALIEINKALKTWPSQPTFAQRRHLAALFIASNDLASAYVQWLQLPIAEQHVGNNLDAALVAELVQLETRNDESYQIAARLAARLSLQRVFAVDNHTGDHIDVADLKAFVRDIEAAWEAGSAEAKQLQKHEEILSKAEDLLPLYRYINSPKNLLVGAEHNVRASMRAKSAEAYPQIWVAGWEIRNLRMVANIRESFRERPGARVLSVVGATHKPWFDGWLRQLQGVDVVDVATILK